MKRYRTTNKKTGKQQLLKKPVDVAMRLVMFGNNPRNYIVEKMLDSGRWKVVELNGKEVYQIERELKRLEEME